MRLIVLLASVVLVSSHSDEPPHLKYSREANEAASVTPHTHSHAHSHAESGGNSHNTGGHVHTHDHAEFPYVHGDAATTNNIWVSALSATLLISSAPLFLLLLIPIEPSESRNGGQLLKILLAFGSGGLLGDAFLHLIPHAQLAIGSAEHAHGHSHDGHSHGPHEMDVGLWVLAGILSFFAIEKITRGVREESGHVHSHGTATGGGSVRKDEGGGDKQEHGHTHITSSSTAALLNLVADFAHNFTDGLAIGASFLAGNTVGAVTTFTVLVHEVPHEIGDLALLVQAGYSKRKAVLLQLVTALGAVSGCLLSLLYSGSVTDDVASAWVLPFTAGGFIYIATVSILPSLLESSSSIVMTLLELLSLLLGIFLMYLVALFE